MPDWLQLSVTVIGIISAVCGGVAIIYKLTYKVNTVVDRPYPCQELADLQNELSQHNQYLSSDRKRIEQLEKDNEATKVRVEGVVSDLKEIKGNTNQILMLLIKKGGNG